MTSKRWQSSQTATKRKESLREQNLASHQLMLPPEDLCNSVFSVTMKLVFRNSRNMKRYISHWVAFKTKTERISEQFSVLNFPFVYICVCVSVLQLCSYEYVHIYTRIHVPLSFTLNIHHSRAKKLLTIIIRELQLNT